MDKIQLDKLYLYFFVQMALPLQNT